MYIIRIVSPCEIIHLNNAYPSTHTQAYEVLLLLILYIINFLSAGLGVLGFTED